MDATLTSAPGPGWRSALRPLITTRGYAALTHHLLGLPLGVAYSAVSRALVRWGAR